MDVSEYQFDDDEIEDVVNEDMETVVIGNGSHGNAVIMKETKQLLKSKGIKMHLMNTYDAVDLYNQLPKKNWLEYFILPNNCYIRTLQQIARNRPV